VDATIKTALIAAIAAVITAAISASATIWVSRSKLEDTAHRAKEITKEAETTLKQTRNLLRTVYDNGTVSQSSVTGGKMIVLVNGSRSGGPVSTPIDMNRFAELCGDVDGCQLSLGATRFREIINDNVTDRVIEAPLLGSPCRFSWSKENRQWSLSQHCAAVYSLMTPNKNGEWVYWRPYQIYEYSNSFGVDDSGGGSIDRDGQPLIVMSFKGACYLAESSANTLKGNGQFMPDDPRDLSTGRGLFLIASSPTWDFTNQITHGSSYPKDWPADDPARQCLLIVED
jgi:hypothetical protein